MLTVAPSSSTSGNLSRFVILGLGALLEAVAFFLITSTCDRGGAPHRRRDSGIAATVPHLRRAERGGQH